MANIKILIITVLVFNINFSISSQKNEYVNIKGIIIDKSLRSISYANIISKKTGLGNISKEDGSFYIKVLKNDTLIFSAISFKKKHVAVRKFTKETNYITLELLIYDLNTVNIIGLSRWQQFKEDFKRKKLKPMEQKILTIKGLPDPFMKITPVNANPVLNPISFLYEKFNKEAIRKRKQARWRKIYMKTWISNER